MNETRGLWRGKTLYKGEWIEGYLISPEFDLKSAYIGYLFDIDDHDTDVVQVDSSTLGECTGLRDKNGNLIFEGDICAVASPNIADDEYGVIKYDHDEAAFVIEFDGFTISFVVNINSSSVEIIGNIHDNPELQKSHEEELK